MSSTRFTEEERERKDRRLAAADAEFSRLQQMARDAGLELWRPTDRHWQVLDRDGSVAVNYWPTTRRQQNGPHSRSRPRVSLHDFEYKLRLLCDQS